LWLLNAKATGELPVSEWCNGDLQQNIFDRKIASDHLGAGRDRPDETPELEYPAPSSGQPVPPVLVLSATALFASQHSCRERRQRPAGEAAKHELRADFRARGP
jgi:hypothetical protein